MLSSREAALKIICDTLTNGSYLNISYKNVTEKENFSPKDAAFIKELSFGTVCYKITLDFIINQFVDKKKKISPEILNILRLGVYQLKFTDKIPPSAAVNESVKLAAKYKGGSFRGFVNGVLRNILRQEEIVFPKPQDKNYLSIKYSYTPSMTGALVKSYGREFCEELMEKMNKPAETSIRTNTLKITRDELVKKLNDEGIFAKENEMTPSGIFVKSLGAIYASRLYKEGYFTVQDTASQLVAPILSPKEGDVVLDLCASPGGKTTHMAELMNNRGKILAFDLYEKRLESVKENAKRLGIDIISCAAKDSSVVDKSLLGIADKLLLDAPCSGWGVIRRKPDIKYKSENTDYKELTNTQKALIETASGYLKSGGEMVYSTCTLNKGENERVLDTFLENHPEFSLVFQKTFFPNIDGCDGFFISKLIKN